MRGKGEGSIYKRSDGLWAAAVELPPRNGQRRRKVVTGKDKATVQRKLRDSQLTLRQRGDLPTASETVEHWLTYWVEEIAAKKVRPKTLEGYRTAVYLHLIPTIGKVRLNQLTAAHVRRVHDAMLAGGRASTYALLVHRILSKALKVAERDGRIHGNPATLTDAPVRSLAPQEALTVEEAIQVLRHVAPDPLYGARWATALLTGARRGEVLGLERDRVTDVLDLSWQLQRLRWAHGCGKPPTCGRKRTTDCPDRRLEVPADFEHRHVTGNLYLTRPKSSAGWRIVPLVDPLKTILERYVAATPPNPWGLVFAPEGRPIDPDQDSKRWRTVLAATGIERDVVLHGLRHTAVDLLYEAGVPEVLIMEIVGHSSRAVTRGYRSKGNQKQLRAAMEQMATLLASPTPAIEEGSA